MVMEVKLQNCTQICILLCLLLLLCTEYVITTKELEDELLTNYSVKVVPKPEGGGRRIINASFHMIFIVNFDEREETLKSSAWLSLSWKDPFLSWEGKAKYENESVIYLHQSDIWKPDFVLINSAEDIKRLGKDNIGVTIKKDGTVIWEPGQTFKSVCEVNINMYPFDSQECTFWFGSWAYFNEIEGILTLPKIGFNAYQENGKWEVTGSYAKSEITTYDYYSQPTLKFILHLRRRRTYYLLTICIPMVILSIINCLVHLLPVDSGERMSFCITVLLSYMVFISFLNDTLPSTSKTVSVLVVYLILIISLSFVSVVNSVIVLYLWHKSSDTSVSHVYGISYKSTKISDETLQQSYGEDEGDTKHRKDVPHPDAVKMNTGEINDERFQKYARALDSILFFIMVFITLSVTVTVSVKMFSA